MRLSCKLVEHVQYSDDMTLYLSEINLDSVCQTMSSQLQVINHRFHLNKLSLNITVTHYMFFTRSNLIRQNVCMRNVPLERGDQSRILVVFVDKRLSFKGHADTLNKKLSNTIEAKKKS